jgi:hypothetical protein
MSDTISIALRIDDKIKLLERMRVEIRERAEKKAIAISEYDKAIAITLIKLKNKVEMTLDDQKVINPPASIMEKIAKGICFKERLEAEKSDALYKSLISNIDSVQAELNGLQSVNRHLDNL